MDWVTISDHTLWQIGIYAQIVSYCVGAIAAILAVVTYRANARKERAKWTVQLYEKFYETQHYKRLREELDCDANAASVATLVTDEGSDFTDHLNFFEMVTILVRTGQLAKSDVLNFFQYYLQCLKRHQEVMRYLKNPDKGFESLSEFLRKN